MTCPSTIMLSMHADDALDAPHAASVEQHTAGCAACRARIAELRAEAGVLRAALQHADDAAPIPHFSPPQNARDLLALVLGVAMVGGLCNAFWGAVAASVPSGLLWLNPLQSGELIERAISVVTFIIYEGTAMWTASLNFIGIGLLLAVAGWLAVAATRRRGAFGAAAACVLALVVALPSVSHALERRNGVLITIPAGETIDDTLIAAGETIAIDGNVNGDLLAFGRSVTIRGNVTGNLVSGAETVMVEGNVGGSFIGGARALSLANGRLGGNLYGFGRDVDVEGAAQIVGNVLAFGESVDVSGGVGDDLTGFGRTVTISGNVQGDVEAFAEEITLLPSARIGGNLTARVDDTSNVTVSPGAVVGGQVDTQLVEREQRRNRYLTVGYYVRQIVRLGAAFLTGLVLFWAFPALREISLPNTVDVLKSGAIGFAAAVALPIAALLVCLTIVGIPIAVLAFVLGAIGLYFSKTVLANVIGRSVLRAPQGPPHYAATLFTGLLIVIVVINLPLIGGLANFLLTIVGFGLIVSLLLARFQRGSLA
jgi:cytoskeletal protein CcmA (bactofilin family)